MTNTINHQQAIKVFYSYTHADEDFRDSLETRLAILKRKGHIDEWHDRKIVPGSDWEEEIDSKLTEADLILLLISPDFIASDYCYSVEMIRAIELHESKDCVVVPIIVRPTDLTDEPFARIQSLPKDRIPITTWDNIDLAWLDVGKGLKKTIETIQSNIQENTERTANTNNKLRGMRDLLSEEVDRIDAAFNKNDNECSGIPTGFDTLDAMLDGVHQSDFWVVVARPQMGKTDFLLKLLENFSIGHKIPVALFSMQLSSNKITRKLTSSLGRIDIHRQLTGNLTDEDWARLTSAIHILAEADPHIFINDNPELSINELTNSVKELCSQNGISVLLLDGLQNLTLDHNKNNSDPTNISKCLKKIARELKIPIIATLPLHNQLEQRVDKRPTLSDLGDWDNLQNDADKLIFLYRDELYSEDSVCRGMADIIVAKNNDGPIGSLKLTYIKKYASFENYIPEIYATPETEW